MDCQIEKGLRSHIIVIVSQGVSAGSRVSAGASARLGTSSTSTSTGTAKATCGEGAATGATVEKEEKENLVHQQS